MQQYKDFRPTGFDPKGAFLPERQEWYVVPVSRTRDTTDPIALSNFEVALELLGGEQDDIVEVHRFGHWGPGWFEIILVHPDKLKIVEDIEDVLADYLLLSEEHYSQTESELANKDWDDFWRKEVARELSKFAANNLELLERDVFVDCFPVHPFDRGRALSSIGMDEIFLNPDDFEDYYYNLLESIPDDVTMEYHTQDQFRPNYDNADLFDTLPRPTIRIDINNGVALCQMV